MGSPSTLQILNSREGYAAHFMDLDIWEPFLRKVCEKHRFSCGKVCSGVPGSFPTFIVEMEGGHTPRACDAVVVKFFGPLYGGLGSFSIEREMGRWIDLQSLPITSLAFYGNSIKAVTPIPNACQVYEPHQDVRTLQELAERLFAV